VQICGVLGCEEATPYSEAADPLAKQLSEGAIDGHAGECRASRAHARALSLAHTTWARNRQHYCITLLRRGPATVNIAALHYCASD